MWGSTICHLNSSWCFFWSHPSNCNWVAFWHLLRRQVCSAVLRGKLKFPSAYKAGEKGPHKWRNLPWVEVFQWTPYSSLGPIPFYRFDQLDMLVLNIACKTCMGRKFKKGLFNYPERNLDLSGWWFFAPNQRDSPDGVPKTGWDWQRPHQGSFDATSAFDALLLLMAKTFDAFPKHGVSRSCIRSFIGTNARAGSFCFRMGAAIPSSSAVLWGHGFSFFGLTPRQKASALLMKDVNRTRIDTHSCQRLRILTEPNLTIVDSYISHRLQGLKRHDFPWPQTSRCWSDSALGSMACRRYWLGLYGSTTQAFSRCMIGCYSWYMFLHHFKAYSGAVNTSIRLFDIIE